MESVKTRLSKAIHTLTVQLANGGISGAEEDSSSADARGGALIQVWMPNALPDGSIVLSAQVGWLVTRSLAAACRPDPADTV